MNIEDELRGALDVAAPPPTTTLDHVLKRGRRRVFVQRAGAVLGVFAVVAGIGIGSTTINLSKPPAPADEVGHGPPVVVHDVDWPRVQQARRTPVDPAKPESGCEPTGDPILGHHPQNSDRFSTWVTKLRSVVPEMQVTALDISGYQVLDYQVEVADGLGPGKVRLTWDTFDGSPLEAADAAVWATRACDPPRRTTDANGVVYQLYDARPADPEFGSIVQDLYVFRPDRKIFRVEQFNTGMNSPRGTRALPPLTPEQFVKLGPIIAEVG